MPKLFVISDVHGFYDEMIEALDKAGFDRNNKDHFLISCGDELDRGTQPKEMLDFLHGLERKIIVRGNHLDLMEECIQNEYFASHDISNGTVATIMDLANMNNLRTYPSPGAFVAGCTEAWPIIRKYSKMTVNYFETEHYIFVHSWIPYGTKAIYHPEFESLPKIYRYKDEYVYDPDWRNAHTIDWEEARWVNPYKMASMGLNQTGKTIVSGHWHCSTYWAMAEGRSEFYEDAKFDIAYDKEHNFIGIDACTAHTHKVNVLVLEDNFLEEENEQKKKEEE